MKKQFAIGIDHPVLTGAKANFDTCLRAAFTRAIATGSDEGSATLKISFEILTSMDKDTGEMRRIPVMKHKATYSVPMKESLEATVAEDSRLIQEDDGGYIIVNGQVSMEELLKEEG